MPEFPSPQPQEEKKDLEQAEVMENIEENRRGFLKRFVKILGAVPGVAVIGAVLKKAYESSTNRTRSPSLMNLPPDVREHLTAENIQWMTVEDFLAQQGQHCIDGRACDCGVCTPGGDMGDLIMKLAAVEEAAGKQIDLSAEEILNRVMKDRKAPFYMHTDLHAYEHAAKEAGLTVEQFQALIKQPGNRKEELLALLTKPENVGCGHLKFMIKKGNTDNPKKSPYPGVRPDLVRALIAAMYTKMWNGENVVIDPLAGDHTETAVLVMKAKKKLTRSSHVPLVRPNVSGKEVFPLHVDMEELGEELFAEKAAELTGMKVDQQTLREIMRTKRGSYLKASAGELLKNKQPTYEVAYDPDTRTLGA